MVDSFTYVWIAFVLVILLIIFATTAMVFYYRRYVCYYNPSPYCYDDWTCPEDTSPGGQDVNPKVKDCSTQHPTDQVAQYQCVFKACEFDSKGNVPEGCEGTSGMTDESSINLNNYCKSLYPKQPAKVVECVTKGCTMESDGKNPSLCYNNWTDLCLKCGCRPTSNN